MNHAILKIEAGNTVLLTGKKIRVRAIEGATPEQLNALAMAESFDSIEIRTVAASPATAQPQPQPFDLEAAKAGKPIVTRGGKSARLVAHLPEMGEGYRVVAAIEGVDAPIPFHENGMLRSFGEDQLDLFMAPDAAARHLNGHEYPEAVSNAPADGQEYFYPVPTGNIELGIANNATWRGTPLDAMRFHCRMVHLTREAAEAHAKAIICASGGRV